MQREQKSWRFMIKEDIILTQVSMTLSGFGTLIKRNLIQEVWGRGRSLSIRAERGI